MSAAPPPGAHCEGPGLRVRIEATESANPDTTGVGLTTEVAMLMRDEEALEDGLRLEDVARGTIAPPYREVERITLRPSSVREVQVPLGEARSMLVAAVVRVPEGAAWRAELPLTGVDPCAQWIEGRLDRGRLTLALRSRGTR